MRRIKSKTNKFFKKIASNFKRSWRKLKYLDRTQLNYFIVTSFIGIFCLFTGTTYSLFTVSKYLNAATITVAKLNYTLSSSSSNFNNGMVTIPAGETVYLNLDLTSLNPMETKYALKTVDDNSNVNVYYSQSLKYNLDGIIGSNGSTITMRVVLQNTSDANQIVNLTVAGGYLQNNLISNISNGYFEQDITIRTVLLDENFENAIQSNGFPVNDGNYAYYKTECNTPSIPAWDYKNWTLNISGLYNQASCDIYFKKISSDIEIYFMLQDSNAENGILKETVPNDNTYTFQKVECSSDAGAFWDNDEWQLEVNNISEKTLCVAYFIHN